MTVTQKKPTAIAKLNPSRLSRQLELLNTDIDLASLNLAIPHEASFPLLEAVTSADVERTIEGSTTLTIVARDRDRVLQDSGLLDQGKVLDCEIDGLWFRLWAKTKNGSDLTLTFIDREIAVLKAWPPTSQGVKMYRHWPANKFGLRTRFRFAEQLILDVHNQLPIRFVCPGLSDATLQTGDTSHDKALNRGRGFPDDNNVTVKRKKATKTQLANLETILDVASSLNARRKVMIAGVAVVTQESVAKTSATNGDHVGLFQQSAAAGWPATRDPATDATAFFEAAISDDRKNPHLAIEDLADDVQVSGHPELYAQWLDEATATVDEYLGRTDSTLPASVLTQTNAPDPTRGQFMRGTLESPSAAARKRKQSIVTTSQGNKIVVREGNWACFARLAAEIGWRAFVVSGTAYMIDDYTLFHQKVAMTISEETDGVDSIDWDFTQGVENAQVTVTCRADRWTAAPGQVVALKDSGPANGRWLVTSFRRSLFNPLTTITLKKPLPATPESAAPEHTAGTAVTVYTPSGTDGSKTLSDGTRAAIVAAARKAIALQKQSGGSRYHYLQRRPMPTGLFADNPESIDCSAFATLVYKAAGAPDPNGRGYDGQGNTGTLAANGTDTDNPQPGDLVFYHDTWAYPGHVAVYLGDGMIANMGSDGEPVEESILAPGIPLGNRTYRLAATTTRGNHGGAGA